MRIELWHGSDRPLREIHPGSDGGIHLGTREQAMMRNSAFLHRISVEMPGKMARSKDTGGGWAKKISQARASGHEVIRYLNRWEGIPHDWHMRTKKDPDDMTDAEFRKTFPEMTDSYIMTGDEPLRASEIIPGPGMITLYHGTGMENAENLMRDGFNPERYVTGSNGGRRGHLYLTDDPENARWYAERADNGVVLKIRVRAEDLIVDPEDGTHEDVTGELMSELPASLATRTMIMGHHFRVFETLKDMEYPSP